MDTPPATGRTAIRQPIVASGGGGFSPVTERSRVEEHVITLAREGAERAVDGVVETVLPARVLP